MTEPNWDGGKRVTVPAMPTVSGYWTIALEYLDGPKRLKLEVADEKNPYEDNATEAGKWNYAPEKQCTADGDPKAPVNPANCLFPDAPAGALIGKIGGSTAGKNDGTKFVVGSFCVIDLDEKTKGPLYLTMNADPMSSMERSGNLSVVIYRSA
jgi:hypothetical protein